MSDSPTDKSQSTQQPSESGRQRLPFEPKRSKKTQPAKTQAAADSKANSKAKQSGQPRSRGKSSRDSESKPAKAKAAAKQSESKQSISKRSASKQSTLDETRIPDKVGRRMISRMMIFSGLPTFMGVGVFVLSYFIVTQGLLELPNTAVLLTSLLCFGLGVVGLSYGVLSSSWDEEMAGSLLGVAEFQTNFGRLVGAWREAREAKRQGDK
ncbi:MAG: PAM68 family protein [Cyanobacteria bacterium P01_H01_bin.121]